MDEIKGMVHHFYEHLFSTESCPSVNEVLNSIPVKITDDMNEALCKDHVDIEIETDLFQMGPTNTLFLTVTRRCFTILTGSFLERKSVARSGVSFLAGNKIPTGFFDSVIVLIPKINNPRHLKNFRPISLCNVFV
jgi:hypothetical protein